MMTLKDTIMNMLEIAKYAPSGGNLQPWIVYLIATENNKRNDSMEMIFTIDKQMEQGQYADLGMFVENIKLLCPEYGLNSSHITFFQSQKIKQIQDLLKIPSHEVIFCSMKIAKGTKKQNKRKMSKSNHILVPKL
eukprot:172120_1